MVGLAETLAALSRWRRDLGQDARDQTPPRIENPAGLGLRCFVPPRPAPGMTPGMAPGMTPGMGLVVALHGCTETALGFDQACGWSSLAERAGFALLLPQQVAANHPAGCFNWFAAAEQRADGRELRSIRFMIADLLAHHPIDPARVFLMGLSAGAAMAQNLLATSPGLFAAAALIGGLPFAAASDQADAVRCMAQGPALSSASLVRRLQDALPAGQALPALSLWHGGLDQIVVADNGRALLAQWQGALGLAATPDTSTRQGGLRHDGWAGTTGRNRLEFNFLPLLGHAVPLSLADPDPASRIGQIGPYAHEAGVGAIAHIARFFGLLPPVGT